MNEIHREGKVAEGGGRQTLMVIDIVYGLCVLWVG